jgi:hypothetical protein
MLKWMEGVECVDLTEKLKQSWAISAMEGGEGKG